MKLPAFIGLNLTTRLFWVSAVLVVLALFANTVIRYVETQKIVETRAYNRAKALQDYFVSMRFVYHQQFLKSGVDLNDSTVGFLPAHAASLISDEYSRRTTQGISIRNVSDKPRNPKNMADDTEKEAIRYFAANPDQNESIKRIYKGNQEFFFFASPLRVQQYCLVCHGEKENTLEYIRNRYDTAYGYKVGDVRGLTSILIPVASLEDQIMGIFWDTTYFMGVFSAVLLIVVYIAIREAARQEEKIKERLEYAVKEKTAELRSLYTKEMHLSSILKTVADVNQLLITSNDTDELIENTAKTLSMNDSFASVKIVLLYGDELKVAATEGIIDENVVTEVDEFVFANNKSLKITDFDDENVPEHCRRKAKTYGIKAVYSAPLKSSSSAKTPVGVITVCTAQSDGFSQKECDMIDELAGDIGFAVNSFAQKKLIERLHTERLNSYEEFIEALVDMIEQRDTYTAGHTKRVAVYSELIAREMGVSEADIKKLVEAAKLHDIGKVVTPDSVLLKPGSLTKLEYELIKEHVGAGFQVLSNIASYKELAQIVIYHHERYDGSGYPGGVKGEDIPIFGRILAVADSFDAMTTNRIYKPRKSIEESLRELEELSGIWYHPDVVRAAVKVLADIRIDTGIDQMADISMLDKERLSYFFKDRLTKLYNEDYLTVVLSGRSGVAVPSCLAVVSLSNFTQYNKEHSWEGGNALLEELADYLMKSFGGSLIFRIRGDHFVIADCDANIDDVMSNSPLRDKNVSYKIKKIYTPFGSVKEALLET